MKTVNLESDEEFEIIIILSLLSRCPVSITNLTDADDKIAFVQFIKCISPDSEFKLSNNHFLFSPGPLIEKKKKLKLDNIPYYLKYIIFISPFLKEDITLDIHGITNMSESVDMFKITFYNIFRAFKLPSFEINIKKRGFSPAGDGLIVFKGHNIVNMDNISIVEEEDIQKIRGMVITARMSSEYSHRMINEIKSNLSDLANTKILCITNNRNDSGPSPGYECSISAESKTGIFFATCSSAESNYKTPEDMAKKCCCDLLKSLGKGGIFDIKLLPFVIVFMGLSKGIGNLKVGKLDKKSQRTINLMKQFFNVDYTFTGSDSKNKILNVIGIGYKNSFKPL